MGRALAVQIRSESWQREDGRFIPMPASWLNGRRWEDLGTTIPTRRGVHDLNKVESLGELWS